VCIDRAHAGDAFVDVERSHDDAPHVRRAENVRLLTLAPGALGLSNTTPLTLDPQTRGPTPRSAR
jgi:hypothetical protein